MSKAMFVASVATKNINGKSDLFERLDKLEESVKNWKRMDDVPEAMQSNYDIEEMKDIKLSVLDAIKYLREDQSDISTINGGENIIIYISGGMTMGDFPTIASECLCLLIDAGFPDARDESN